jgi:hypothetical protein
MGKASQNGDLIAKGLKHFKRFIESEIPSFALGKPVPMTEFTVLIGKAYTIGEIDRTKPAWR